MMHFIYQNLQKTDVQAFNNRKVASEAKLSKNGYSYAFKLNHCHKLQENDNQVY